MIKINNKKYLITFLVLFLFFIILPIFAIELEVDYPEIKPEETETIEGFFVYIYKFIVTISGLITLGVIIWGGIIWLISADDPAKIKEAKERIFGGLIGIVLIFSVYLILSIINPELTILNLGKEKVKTIDIFYSGFYACNLGGTCDVTSLDFRKCLSEATNKGYCQKLEVGENSIPKGEYTLLYSAFNAGDKLEYVIFTGDSLAGYEKTYSTCSVTTNLKQTFGNQSTVGSLVINNASKAIVGNYYIKFGEVSVYLNDKGTLPGIKFCERLGCPEKKENDIESKIWYKGISKNNMTVSFGEIMSPVREIVSIPIEIKGIEVIPEYKLILFEKQNFEGPCFVSDETKNFTEGLINFQQLYDTDEKHSDGTKNLSYLSSYAEVGSMVALPLGGERDPDTEEKEIRAELTLGGISINKACGYNAEGGQTCVAGLPYIAIKGLIALKNECGCEVVITGGTEPGHTTHGPGKPIVDLRTTPDLNSFLTSTSCSGCATYTKECRCEYNFDNYKLKLYRHGDETNSDHWHVEFSN